MKVFTATKAFVMSKGKVLLLRQSSKYEDGANVGKYDVPGGRVEPGQRFDDSLLREIKEETGLSVVIKGPFHVDEWRPVVRGEEWQIIGIYFICEASSSDVRLSKDHDDFVWMDPKDYEKYELLAGVDKAFGAFLARSK